jgi:transposase-like protein
MKWTPEQDAVFIERYSRNKYGGNANRMIAKAFGVSPNVTYARAVQLGLIHSRERYRWLQTELDVVEKYAHCALETIQRKLTGVSPHKRTRTAIARQIARLRLRSSLDGLNHTQLAQALGVADSTLHKWRQDKLIKAHRLPSLDQHKGAHDIYLQAPWYYSHMEIKRFVFRFPSLIDLRKVNQLWFIELVRDGRFQATLDKDMEHV